MEANANGRSTLISSAAARTTSLATTVPNGSSRIPEGAYLLTTTFRERVPRAAEGEDAEKEDGARAEEEKVRAREVEFLN